MINCARSNFYNVETNEITDQESWSVQQNDDTLNECVPHSVCSTLQANAKGINITPLCRCPRPHKCSRLWDSLDGHSVTQGSDQYKFCEPAPEMPICSQKATAYSITMIYSKSTDALITQAHKIHCKCPELHNYKGGNSKISATERFESYIYTVACVPLPTCKASDPCKVVTETAESFLVNPSCVCPGNLSCPTATNHGVESIPRGKGMMHSIYCQKIQV